MSFSIEKICRNNIYIGLKRLDEDHKKWRTNLNVVKQPITV
jgi:hypothetical protein